MIPFRTVIHGTGRFSMLFRYLILWTLTAVSFVSIELQNQQNSRTRNDCGAIHNPEGEGRRGFWRDGFPSVRIGAGMFFPRGDTCIRIFGWQSDASLRWCISDLLLFAVMDCPRVVRISHDDSFSNLDRRYCAVFLPIHLFEMMTVSTPVECRSGGIRSGMIHKFKYHSRPTTTGILQQWVFSIFWPCCISSQIPEIHWSNHLRRHYNPRMKFVWVPCDFCNRFIWMNTGSICSRSEREGRKINFEGFSQRPFFQQVCVWITFELWR